MTRYLAIVTLALCLAGLSTVGPAAASSDLPPVVHSVMPARLVVPTIGVDAPVVEVGLRPDGAMDSPDGPTLVGWYPFSPTPGNPGNTVLSGHRDWRTGVTAVFWRLHELRPGDAFSVVLADGSQVNYAVVLSISMMPDDMPIVDVVGQTKEEIITLITCEGRFNAQTRDYDLRRVVWANRIP